jgi:hypothetical protein
MISGNIKYYALKAINNQGAMRRERKGANYIGITIEKGAIFVCLWRERERKRDR